MSELRSIVPEDRVSRYVDAVSTVVDECKLHLEKNGFRVTAVGPANVFSVHAMLGANAFESYELDDRSVLGLKLGRFDEAISFSDSGAPIQISTDAEPTKLESGETALAGHLHVDTDGIGHDIALIDVDSIRKEPDIPDLDLPAEIVLEGRQLDRAVKAGDTVSDHAVLEVSEDGVFRVLAEGDTDSVDVEYDEEQLIDGTFAEARSLFSIEYLKEAVKPIPADAEVTVQLGVDFPTVITWGFSEGDGSVKYLLAPRIENS